MKHHSVWPKINSSIKKDRMIEGRIKIILDQMTLEEKVGQMIQPNLLEVTPEEAKTYKLGSLLNGGGAWPKGDKHASANDWVNTADQFWLALDAAYEDRPFKIPFIWATDAVHGHNNVFGSTLFPHNIGLGAANDLAMIYRIGQATAKEISVTGLDWTFAPTVATPRDYRWGRVYEGYSEDGSIVYDYAAQMVLGLQGNEEELKGEQHVLSNVKHWIGDGGTHKGIDRGENHYSEADLLNIHGQGYISALNAGAQVVMTSFNSWHNEKNYAIADERKGRDPNYNHKIHGSRYLITDVLKGQMGFDGVVVTDWNGHSEVNNCTASDCPSAINAGNDVFMVTDRADWKPFYHNVIDQVKSGIITAERIDDAVTRILRVKMRAGLWEKPLPSKRLLAGKDDLLGHPEHRALAREAVQKSLVLLKNNRNALPLNQEGEHRFLVVGSGADDIQKQTGGWSLTWQGGENTVADFPGAQTVKQAMIEALGERVLNSIDQAKAGDTAIMVFGENPYAEMLGDIKDFQTLGYADLRRSYERDLALLRKLKAQGLKVISVFFSGRPLYVNEEINLSDAFVAAWLPGSEGGGIVDVLLGKQGLDFRGKLSYSWPNTKCSMRINHTSQSATSVDALEQSLAKEHKPLFAYGYGLNYQSKSENLALDQLPLDPRDYGCERLAGAGGVSNQILEIYSAKASSDFVMRLSGQSNDWSGIAVSRERVTEQGSVTTKPLNYQHQQDALNVKFNGGLPAQIYAQTEDPEQGEDQVAYLQANSVLAFDVRVHQAATGPVILAMHCVWPCIGELALNDLLPGVNDKEWVTVEVPLNCFDKEGMNFSNLNTPFLIKTASAFELDLGNIRLIPKFSSREGQESCS